MAPTSSFGLLPVDRSRGRHSATLVCGFAAALAWWVGLTAYLLCGGPGSGVAGLLVFIGAPALLSAGTYLLAAHRKKADAGGPGTELRIRAPSPTPRIYHRGRSAAASFRLSQRARIVQPVVPRRGTPDSLLVVGAFAAALLWWIGVTGYLAVGGFASGVSGLAVFLAVPALATVGTCLAFRGRRSPRSLRPGHPGP